ncbi:MAG: hypothetical protein V3581_00385 [Candidatus Cardinium sp.]|uniref:hypothetical protein n=1 Tax=Candidatus Cardinium sp. TP TaxID=2961955 RepID=UPI0021AF822C|nr:hypothetical protein [Candidatus Cardinium sp. TP]MCT4697432.1 hypothetical protein [Candidatus Cardinium sp. TP]MDN5246735.1 hypothetical protein [Candidatus Cardinium sp.]
MDSGSQESEKISTKPVITSSVAALLSILLNSCLSFDDLKDLRNLLIKANYISSEDENYFEIFKWGVKTTIQL